MCNMIGNFDYKKLTMLIGMGMMGVMGGATAHAVVPEHNSSLWGLWQAVTTFEVGDELLDELHGCRRELPLLDLAVGKQTF